MLSLWWIALGVLLAYLSFKLAVDGVNALDTDEAMFLRGLFTIVLILAAAWCIVTPIAQRVFGETLPPIQVQVVNQHD